MDFKATHFNQFSPPDFFVRVSRIEIRFVQLTADLHDYQEHACLLCSTSGYALL